MTPAAKLDELRAEAIEWGRIGELKALKLIDVAEAAAAYRFWQLQAAIVGADGMAEKYKRELDAALARLGGGR